MSAKGVSSKEYKKPAWCPIGSEAPAPLVSSPSSSSSEGSPGGSPVSPRNSKVNPKKSCSEDDSDSNDGRDVTAESLSNLYQQNYLSKRSRSFRPRRSASRSSSEGHSLSKDRSISPDGNDKGRNVFFDNNTQESNSKTLKEVLKSNKCDESKSLDDQKKSGRLRASSSESDEGLLRKKLLEKEPIKKFDATDEKIVKKDAPIKRDDENAKESSKSSHGSKRLDERRRRDASPERKAHRSKRLSSRSRSRSPVRHRQRDRSPYRSRRRSRSRERYRDRSPRRRRSRSRDRGYRGRDSRRTRSRSYERRHHRRHRSSSRDRYRRRRRSHSSSRSGSRSRLSSRERSKGRSGLDFPGPSGNKVGSLPLSTTAGTMTPQMALQQTMAAMSAKAQALTGVELPKYYNPAAVNPLKYAEQVQKRKLLWQNKDKEKEDQSKSSMWEKLKFAQDQDGKMTAKFRKLMGIKSEGAAEEVETEQKPESQTDAAPLQQQEELFRNLDQQYEVARLSTHTHRGVGLGYSSQAIFPPIQKP